MVAVEIRNLKKTYSNGVVALKGIDLDIYKGDFYALLGPNGAGKSTTIGILSSLITPTDGSIKVFGLDYKTHSQEIKQKLGIVPQEFNFNIFETPLQIICNQAGFYGIDMKTAKKRALKLLKDLEIYDKKDFSSRSMSGGQKRRLMIARALVNNPEILILDEPTAGVDISLRRQMWQFLETWNKNGLTIILTTHYLEEAEYLCNRIAIIDKGDVITNTKKEDLLNTLKLETLICTTKDSITKLPDLGDLKVVQKDHNIIEVTINSDVSVEELLSRLKTQNIEVYRLSNKSNRLEELFVNLVENN
jgi:ABC-2 type transport system ATP-binding protein